MKKRSQTPVIFSIFLVFSIITLLTVITASMTPFALATDSSSSSTDNSVNSTYSTFMVTNVVHNASNVSSSPVSSSPFPSPNVVVVEVNRSIIREDFFAAMSGKDVKSCSCADVINVITLQNTGNVPSFYTFTTSGEAAQHTTVVPDALRLEPHHEQQVFVHTNTPCQKYTSENLEISMTTNLGLKKTLSKQFEYVPCTNVELRTTAPGYVNCPCTPTKYTINLVNTGDFPEVYKLSMNVPREYYTLSSSELFLLAGKKESVFAYVTFPCEVYGPQEFSLSAAAKTSGFSAELPLYLDASRSCYQFTIQPGIAYPLINNTATYHFIPASTVNYKVCEQGTYFIPLKIKNPSPITNEHDLALVQQSPEWASLNYDSLTLAPQQDADTAIVLSPPEMSEGNYTLTVNTTTVRGDISGLTSLNVEVVNCTPLNEEGEEDTSTTSAMRWFIAVVLGLLFLGVIALLIVFLTSTKPKEFKPSKETKEKPLWVKILLMALAVVIVVALIVLGFYVYYITAVVPELNLNATATNITNISPHSNATQTALAPPMSIPNVTTSRLNATGNITGTMIGNVTAQALSSVKKYTLFLLVGLGGLIVLALVVLLVMNKIKKRKAQGEVGIRKEKDETKEEPAKTVKKETVKKSVEKNVTEKKVPDLSKLVKKKRRWLKIVAIILIALVVLGGIGVGVYFALKTPNVFFSALTAYTQTKNTTDHANNATKTNAATEPTITPTPEIEVPKAENFTFRMWPKNTQKIINLSKHVKDPDNDALTFSFTPVQNISIALNGGVATLTSAKDFTGIRHVTFRANDGKGGEVTLPAITLVVTDTEDEATPFYVGWMVAGAIVLLILVTSVILVAKNKKKREAH